MDRVTSARIRLKVVRKVVKVIEHLTTRPPGGPVEPMLDDNRSCLDGAPYNVHRRRCSNVGTFGGPIIGFVDSSGLHLDDYLCAAERQPSLARIFCAASGRLMFGPDATLLLNALYCSSGFGVRYASLRKRFRVLSKLGP